MLGGRLTGVVRVQVVGTRAFFGGAAVALVAAGLAVAPAIGAAQQKVRSAKPAAKAPRLFGTFTPAAADPRLAAIFAKGGLDGGDFRFTPSETRRDNRAVTVAVRTRTSRPSEVADHGSDAATVGLAPIAYNLGVSLGWKRFAISGDVAKVDLAGRPGSREAADVAVTYDMKKFTGRVKASADRPVEGAPRLVDTGPSYSLDVGGSYSLTRNLAVTAGVRYRTDRDRLTQINDDRRDSQAVYLGTAFRF